MPAINNAIEANAPTCASVLAMAAMKMPRLVEHSAAASEMVSRVGQSTLKLRLQPDQPDHHAAGEEQHRDLHQHSG
jgi:hypothetical protein